MIRSTQISLIISSVFSVAGCDIFAASYPSTHLLVCLDQPERADEFRLYFAQHVIEGGFLYHDLPPFPEIPLHSAARGEPRPGYWESLSLAAQVPGAQTFMMADNGSLYGHEVGISIFGSNLPESSREFETEIAGALQAEWGAVLIDPRVSLTPGVCDNLDEVAL